MHSSLGKRQTKPILDRDSVSKDLKPVYKVKNFQKNIQNDFSNFSQEELDHYNNHSKPILSYMLSQADQNECPYITVSIYGTKMDGLLDSGANKVFLGLNGYNMLLNMGIKLKNIENQNCQVANGDLIECIGFMSVPIQLQNKIIIFDCYVMPQLRHTLVLGTAFWIKMGIVPDLRKGEWYFGSSEQNFNLNSIQSADDLTIQQRDKLNTVVTNYFDSVKHISLGCTDMVEHEIITNSPPIRSRYYPVSYLMQQKIDQEVTKLLEMDIIEKSDSPWSSPVLMVPKSDGSFRFCVDFRKLNSVSEKNSYPLPLINSILDRLGNSRYLSTLDIKMAYHQVKMAENSKKYTAFRIPGRGHFMFKRLPFGLTNAPATFQSLIDKIFGPELEPYVFKFLDDIVVTTPDFDTHIRILNEVFNRLKAANLTLNKDKCKFCRSELKYVGYIVNRSGLSVDPEKVSAIVDMAIPRTPKQVRSFLGMVSYYRRFVPCLSEMVNPLTNLTKKNAKFKWTPECQFSFEKVKNALVSAPILACPNFEKPYFLHCDASSYGLGCVLTQEYDGKCHVICYLSRTLNKHEMKYSVTEKELLCVIWAIEKLRCYLELAEFTVVTDHSSLVWLNNLKNPQGRLGRWALRLQQYRFKIIHKRGILHTVPDCLSRAPLGLDTVDSVNSLNFNLGNTTCTWYVNMCTKVRDKPLKYPLWRVDPEGILYKYVNDNDFYEPFDKWKIVLPNSERSKILFECHNDPTAGHLGVYKTYHKILSKYYWPKMKSDVVKYIAKCRVCAEQKPEQQKVAGLMGSKPDVTRCWQYVSTDLMGPFPRSTSGHRFILVVVDYFSKFTLIFPLRTATAKKVAQLMEDNVFMLFGVPEFLRSDNGGQYKSKDFENLLKTYNITFLTNPLYHPAPNFTERYNRIIKTMIRSFITGNQKHWDQHLSKLACALRTAKSEVTKNTPYFINFGYEMITNGNNFKQDRKKQILTQDISHSSQEHTNFKSSDENHTDVLIDEKSNKLKEVHMFVEKQLKQAHLKSSHSYNLRHRPVQFKEGQYVWKKEYNLSDKSKGYSAKLDKKFSGPYKIVRKLGVNTYELVDEQGKSKGKWHVQDLKEDKTQVEFEPDHRTRVRKK